MWCNFTLCIGADFHKAMVATAPGEKLLIERRPVRTISSLFLRRKLHLFLGKSTKTAAARAALFDSNMHQILRLLGLRLRPHWGSLQCSPNLLAVFRGPTSKGRWGKGRGKGRGGKGHEGEEGRGGEWWSSSFALGRKRNVDAYELMIIIIDIFF